MNNKNTSRITKLKFLWLLLVTIILVWTLLDYANTDIEQLKFEIGMRHLILISILSVPLGPFILFIVIRVLDFKAPGIYEILETWVLSVAGGYIQWFVILPYFLKRKKKSAN